MTEHDPRAWRVAIALAHATGLDWARWAMGEATRGECSCGAWAEPEEMHHEQGCAWLDVEHPSPVPAPWDTDAYLADCRRRDVEPGPLPSLEYRREGSADHRFLRFAVSVRYDRMLHKSIYRVELESGSCRIEVCMESADDAWMFMDRCAHLDDVAHATNLARVAAEAMR